VTSVKLLIVDDEESIRKQLQWSFKKDYTVIPASDAAEAIEAVRERKPDVMLLDLSLTGDPRKLEGFDVLQDALGIDPTLKVIVITGHDDRENALRAITLGATDFYAKPVDVEHLRVMIQRAAYIRSLEAQLTRLEREAGGGHEFEGVIAMSGQMLAIFETVRKVATTDVSVLLTGESGTGKELVARAIHRRSARAGKPFVPINCGAIPENLLESELFGHEKGSFTGAHATKRGKFESADGGTIFLDEIGELPLPLQVKLLRFLQDHIIERVGGGEPIPVDVRVIAATNQDLETMIGRKEFREDLFYRINTVRIALPPLRDRGDDLLLLATRFLHRYRAELSRPIRGFSPAALDAMHTWQWAGNVRELDNRIKRAVIMAAGNLIQPADLDLPAPAGAGDGEISLTAAAGDMALREARDRLEKSMVIAALLRSSGNVSAAAQQLDVSRPTLHDLMKKHGVNPDVFRARGDA
jgi:two-component system NtrC family response regulator